MTEEKKEEKKEQKEVKESVEEEPTRFYFPKYNLYCTMKDKEIKKGLDVIEKSHKPMIIDEMEEDGKFRLYKVDRYSINLNNCKPINPFEQFVLKVDNFSIDFDMNKSKELSFDDVTIENEIKLGMTLARRNSLNKLMEKTSVIKDEMARKRQIDSIQKEMKQNDEREKFINEELKKPKIKYKE